MNVSAPEGEHSLAQEHESQQNRAQVKSQQKRLIKKAHEHKV